MGPVPHLCRAPSAVFPPVLGAGAGGDPPLKRLVRVAPFLGGEEQSQRRRTPRHPTTRPPRGNNAGLGQAGAPPRGGGDTPRLVWPRRARATRLAGSWSGPTTSPRPELSQDNTPGPRPAAQTHRLLAPRRGSVAGGHACHTSWPGAGAWRSGARRWTQGGADPTELLVLTRTPGRDTHRFHPCIRPRQGHRSASTTTPQDKGAGCWHPTDCARDSNASARLYGRPCREDTHAGDDDTHAKRRDAASEAGRAAGNASNEVACSGPWRHVTRRTEAPASRNRMPLTRRPWQARPRAV